MRRGPSIALLAVTALVPGCPRTIRTGALIDQYSRAECVPVRFASGVSRAWDYTLKTRQGIAVHVSGAEMPGGRIHVRYLSGGNEPVAADAGSYMCPADGRVAPTSARSYIKPRAIPAAFGGPQP